MKNQVFTYKPEILVSIAQEYLNAAEDEAIFRARHRHTPGGPLWLETEADHIEYHSHDKETVCTWSAFIDACKLVDADPSTVMATVNTMNRYERRNGWKICAHLPSSYTTHETGEERTRRFWSVPDGDADCFKSTGRRKPWTVKPPA